jgi:hypothetical protein
MTRILCGRQPDKLYWMQSDRGNQLTRSVSISKDTSVFAFCVDDMLACSMSGDQVVFLRAIVSGAISGAVAFLFSTFALFYFVEPLRELRKRINDISWWFAYCDTGIAQKDEQKKRFGELAANLHASAKALPLHDVASSLGWVPDKSAIKESVYLLVETARDFALCDGNTLQANMKKVSTLLNLGEPPVTLAPDKGYTD